MNHSFLISAFALVLLPLGASDSLAATDATDATDATVSGTHEVPCDSPEVVIAFISYTEPSNNLCYAGNGGLQPRRSGFDRWESSPYWRGAFILSYHGGEKAVRFSETRINGYLSKESFITGLSIETPR